MGAEHGPDGQGAGRGPTASAVVSDLINVGDVLGFGASWSDPSPGNGVRSETLLELQYRFWIGDSIEITPDVQVIFNPAANPTTRTIWVGGVRLALRF